MCNNINFSENFSLDRETRTKIASILNKDFTKDDLVILVQKAFYPTTMENIVTSEKKEVQVYEILEYGESRKKSNILLQEAAKKNEDLNKILVEFFCKDSYSALDDYPILSAKDKAKLINDCHENLDMERAKQVFKDIFPSQQLIDNSSSSILFYQQAIPTLIKEDQIECWLKCLKNDWRREKKDTYNYWLKIISQNYESANIFGDINWRSKLDRIIQLNTVENEVRQLLNNNNGIKAIVFLWYGSKESGVGELAERMTIHLRQKNIHVKEKSIPWIQKTDSIPNSLAQIYCTSILNENLRLHNKFGQKFREINKHKSPYFIFHEEFYPNALMQPEILEGYIKWIENQFLNNFGIEHDFYFIFGLPFITSDSEQFENEYVNKIISLDFRILKFVDLVCDEIKIKDIISFFKDFRILNGNEAIEAAKKVHEKTNGNYTNTLHELRKIAAEQKGYS